MPQTKKAKKQEYEPWIYNDKPITSSSQFPKNAIGFIYYIFNTRTKKGYYGRKTVFSKKGKVTKELPWLNYHGSNKILQSEVKAGDKCIRTILCFCNTKAEMTLRESEAILCNGALEDENTYNMWVMCRIYKKNLINVK